MESERMAFANINTSDSGATVIIPGVEGRRIHIQGALLIAAGDVTATIEDTDGTDLIGPMALAAKGGFALPPTEKGYQQTEPGKGVQIRLSGAVQVGGSITYTEVAWRI